MFLELGGTRGAPGDPSGRQHAGLLNLLPGFRLSGVDIPTAFYRIVLDEENGQPRVLAFLAPQTMTGHEPLAQFLTSVREVKRHTGLEFYPDLPKEVQDGLETVKAARLW